MAQSSRVRFESSVLRKPGELSRQASFSHIVFVSVANAKIQVAMMFVTMPFGPQYAKMLAYQLVVLSGRQPVFSGVAHLGSLLHGQQAMFKTAKSHRGTPRKLSSPLEPGFWSLENRKPIGTPRRLREEVGRLRGELEKCAWAWFLLLTFWGPLLARHHFSSTPRVVFELIHLGSELLKGFGPSEYICKVANGTPVAG